MNRTPDPPCGPSAGRATAARSLAGVSLASLIALAVPVDGHDKPAAGGTPLSIPTQDLPRLGFTVLPAGWPAPAPEPAPEMASSLEERAWSLVTAACERFGISGQALAMYHVLREESRFLPHVKSPSGRYQGISQFSRSTFHRNVRRMREAGLISKTISYSPLNPAQAIEVMAWMWSQGYSSHWGPYRRVVRQLAAAPSPEGVKTASPGPEGIAAFPEAVGTTVEPLN